jgi:hypothetical protein
MEYIHAKLCFCSGSETLKYQPSKKRRLVPSKWYLEIMREVWRDLQWMMDRYTCRALESSVLFCVFPAEGHAENRHIHQEVMQIIGQDAMQIIDQDVTNITVDQKSMKCNSQNNTCHSELQ